MDINPNGELWGICVTILYSLLAYNVVPIGDSPLYDVAIKLEEQYILLCALYEISWIYDWFFKQGFGQPLKVVQCKEQMCLGLFLIRTLPFKNLVSIMKQALMASFLCNTLLELV